MNRGSTAALVPASTMVALLALGQTASAKSTVNFCNSGNTALSIVTLGDAPGGGWSLDGWRTIRQGECAGVDTIFRLWVGFAVTTADNQRGMQVYSATISPEIYVSVDKSYCIPPAEHFHRRHDPGPLECQDGDMLARFAFVLKTMPGATVTVQIPADEKGAIIPFEYPASSVHSFPPFKPNDRPPPPNASFVLAMRGLAEQQEQLGIRMAHRDPEPGALWSAYYVRDLGMVVRPVTRIASVASGSPADRIGLRHGDEVVAIGDIVLQSAWHARSLLVRTRPGEIRTITFMQKGALRMEKITLEPLPTALALTELHPKQGWLGVEFESAARIVGVIYREGTPHLELGDDILKIGRSDFDGVDGLARWLARDREAAAVEIQVRQKSSGRIVVMTLDKLR